MNRTERQARFIRVGNEEDYDGENGAFCVGCFNPLGKHMDVAGWWFPQAIGQNGSKHGICEECADVFARDVVPVHPRQCAATVAVRVPPEGGVQVVRCELANGHLMPTTGLRVKPHSYTMPAHELTDRFGPWPVEATEHWWFDDTEEGKALRTRRNMGLFRKRYELRDVKQEAIDTARYEARKARERAKAKEKRETKRAAKLNPSPPPLRFIGPTPPCRRSGCEKAAAFKRTIENVVHYSCAEHVSE